MSRICNSLRFVLAAAAVAAAATVALAHEEAPAQFVFSILVYHRFGPAVTDAMTVRTSTFRRQIEYLTQHHYPLEPLDRLVSYLRGEAPAPPARSIFITVDDGHRTVFTEMQPIVREYQIPVTLFIYPSPISRTSYAMTWDELDSMRRTGLFDIQSHTYWHPNFHVEKRRLAPDAYRAFVAMQLERPRVVLKERVGADATLIAWPFGLYDDELIAAAQRAGYVAGFTLDRRLVTPRERIMALPRFLVTDGAQGPAFSAMLPREAR